EVVDRDGKAVKLTETKWGRFAKELAQYDGVTARLRADFGHAAADLMIHHRLVEHEIERPKDIARAIAAIGSHRYERPLLEGDDETFRLRLVETETSTARSISVPVELLASPIYAYVRKGYAKLAEIVGLPPFTVTVGKEQVAAETFGQLRSHVLDAAKTGMQLSRF